MKNKDIIVPMTRSEIYELLEFIGDNLESSRNGDRLVVFAKGNEQGVLIEIVCDKCRNTGNIEEGEHDNIRTIKCPECDTTDDEDDDS